MKKKTMMILCSVPALLAGCTDNLQEETAEEGVLSSYRLVVRDSLGMELGDSAYVFGAIADVEILPDGSFAVLDGTYCNIRTYTKDGIHLSTIASRGTGPGELIHPFCFFNWGDGTIGVMDPNNGGLQRYDLETGNWLGVDLEVNSNKPYNPVVTGDSSYVCFKTEFLVTDDHFDAKAMIAGFDMSLEPRVEYWSKTTPWDPNNMANIILDILFYNSYAISSETGRVYVAPFNEDNYEILCFNSDGSSAGSITMEHTPVPKTPQAIQEEKDFIEFFLRASEGDNPELSYNCDPWPNYLPVSGLFMGPQDNLWARRGGADEMTFDIWNNDLEPAGTAVIPGISGKGQDWQLVMGDEYALLWNENPAEYQKIYILSIDEV